MSILSKNKTTVTNKQIEKELRSVVFAYKKVFLILLSFSVIINLLMLTPPVYMLQMYDRVLNSRNQETLIMLTIIMVILYFIYGNLEGVRSMLMIRLGNSIDEKLSSRIFDTAFEKALRYGNSTAYQPFQDFISIRHFLTGPGLFAFFDAPWTPIYILVIYLIHPYLGLFAIISSIILIIMAVLSEIFSRKTLADANKMNIKATAFAGSNFKNAEAIEAMGMLTNIRVLWYKMQEQFINLQSKASERVAIVHSFTKFLRITFQSLILGLGAYLAIKDLITPGMMIAASILMGMALRPVESAIGQWKNLISVRDAYIRLEELFKTFPKKYKGMPLPPPKGHLQLQSVIVAPPGSTQEILKGITLEASPGDIIGIIGPTGAGKTTLAKTIVGIWKPIIGSVRLDGADIYQWDKEDLGKYIGYLPQNIELLDGTIAENISRFSGINSEKVIEAAQKTGIHETILQMPNGYDTMIGDGGYVLSGGQKQRVALARALYGDPVLFVLDEPNSNLDDKGEIALMNVLLSLKEQKRTVFAITHRTTLLNVVDKILCLMNGTVQAYGPKNEVIALLQRGNQPTSQRG